MLTTCASPRANRSACRERVAIAASFPGRARQFLCGMCLTRYFVMIGCHAGSRNPCFQAPVASAPAVGPGVFVRRGTRKRVVTPFSANPARPVEQPSIDARPPPRPVPRITPNTMRAFSPAPSIASDKAKQLVLLASCTGVASATARSWSKGRPLSQVELAFCIRPVRGEMDPGRRCRSWRQPGCPASAWL